MPDCDRCGRSFDDEDAYLDHLTAEHPDDLGPIEHRRIADREEEGGLPMGPIILAAILLVVVGIVLYAIVALGGGDDGPTDVGSVHYHGSIDVIVLGDPVDFSHPYYQRPRENPAFHFEAGTERWHVHAQGVTLAYALSTVDIEITETSVTINGTTYRDGDTNTAVSVQVNGESADPSTYVLQQGDSVRVEVRRE